MNIRSIYLAGLFAIIGSHIINTNAQQLRNPFDFPILLSGNFGELRSNHFHSGIDFKTQGVEGKPVHTVQEALVDLISILRYETPRPRKSWTPWIISRIG